MVPILSVEKNRSSQLGRCLWTQLNLASNCKITKNWPSCAGAPSPMVSMLLLGRCLRTQLNSVKWWSRGGANFVTGENSKPAGQLGRCLWTQLNTSTPLHLCFWERSEGVRPQFRKNSLLRWSVWNMCTLYIVQSYCAYLLPKSTTNYSLFLPHFRTSNVAALVSFHSRTPSSASDSSDSGILRFLPQNTIICLWLTFSAFLWLPPAHWLVY